MSDLQKQIEKLQAENEELEEQLKSTPEVSGFEEQIEKLQEENAELKEQLSALQEEFEKLQAENAEFEEQLKNMPDISDIEAQLEKLEAENLSLTEQLKDSQGIAYSAIKSMLEEKKVQKEKGVLNRGSLKILGTGDNVEADIVEEGMYFTGDKVYKWGDILHLDK